MQLIDDVIRHNRLEIDSDDTKVWCIGDVHGCANEFHEMLESIEHIHEENYPDQDLIIFQLGDLIDRGPYFEKPFHLCYLYDVNTIIGNHELNFLIERDGKKCRSKPRQESHRIFDDTLSNHLQEFVMSVMRSSYNFYEVMVGDRVYHLSHAPLKHLYDRRFDMMRDVGSAFNYCTNSEEPYGTIERKSDDRRIINIYGHQHFAYRDIDANLEAVDNNEIDYVNIDSGAVYGHCLTAFCLNDHSIIQINSEFDCNQPIG